MIRLPLMAKTILPDKLFNHYKYYLNQPPPIIPFCLTGAGSFTSIIMLTAELMLEHALFASN